jgi:biotin operon repressor
MSRQVAKLVYDRKIGSMLRKAVLAYFAERANDDGSMIWASKKTIADEIECSKQAVINTVKQFLAEGILIEVGHKKTQGGFTVVYDMDLAIIAALPKAKQSIELTSQYMDQSTPLAEPVNPVDLDQSTPLTQTVHEPSIKPEAKASKCAKLVDDYPMPEWAEPSVWADYMKNRKRKNKPSTPTAYKRFCDDINRLSDEEWPPGRLLEHAAAEGWAGIYDPRDKQNGNNGRNQNNSSRNGKPVNGFAAALRHIADGPPVEPFGIDR